MKITFAAVLAILLATVLFIYNTTSESGVAGSDAFKIALQSPKYVIMSIVSIVGSIVAVYFAIKNSWDEDGKGAAVVVAAALIMFISVLLRPINIKNDFQSANITTEQIQYIKDHLKK